MTILPSHPSAGWYPDPAAAGTMRWFDGVAWTDHTAPAPVTMMPVHTVPSAGSPPPPSFPPAGSSGQVPEYRSPYAGQGQYYGAPAPQASPAAFRWIVPIDRSWQAIVAGYVALFAMFIWVLGPVALLLGVVALRAYDPRHVGRGRAWFAIVVGVGSSLALLWAVPAWLTSR